FFWLLTTWAYVCYTEVQGLKSKVQSQKTVVRGSWSVVSLSSSIFYLLSLCLFALGLMCKPVLVTFPFVLLLLDYWPLRRFQIENQPSEIKHLLPLLREKVPFMVLAVVSSVITILAHRALGSLGPLSRLPWDTRLENALVC